MMEFTWVPSSGASQTKNPAVNRAKFGDGYEQRSRNGINTNPRKWSLRFSNQSDATADAISDFLDDRGGVEAFLWTPPRGAKGVFICSDYTDTYDSVNVRTIAATFEEVFGE
jgi:phage-related protein